MSIQEVRQMGGVPIKSWGIDVEYEAWDQMRNLSLLPGVHSHLAMMPDAHPGYAMPIGGVMATDGIIVPYAIGVDIGCGVALYRFDIKADDVSREQVKVIMDRIRREIPVGNGPWGGHADSPDYGDDFVWGDWERGPTDRILPFVKAAAPQLGTLGGGNHFLELQRGADGILYFMLHSGSRSLGKKVCDYHVKVAQDAAKRWGISLPHKDVAYLPLADPLGAAYMEDMNFAMGWAAENRRRMGWAALRIIQSTLDVDGGFIVDCHHNFAAIENHRGRNLIVHRKGAVRARVGDTVLIPGSMSTGSYMGHGLGNPDSFNTCQHGAGRLRSRAATKRLMAEEGTTLKDLMGDVYLSSPGDVSDESSIAYKDIEAVMDASDDLVEPVLRFTPMGVVKG